MLKTKFPEIYVSKCISRARANARVSKILHDICFAENVLPVSTQVDLLFHLVGFVEGQLAPYEQKQWVLVLDEIQHLNAIEFYNLADLHNYLQAAGISMTVIAFSQPEIYERRSGFHKFEQGQLIARFFSEIITFHGCRNTVDLTMILRACDEGSEFPVGSGISYTAYFIPQAFANGFRLAKMSELFWRLFADSVSGQYHNNLPMEHVREGIANYLQILQSKDNPLLTVDEEDVKAAIHRTNIRTFCDVV